jgi:hypothetical protein
MIYHISLCEARVKLKIIHIHEKGLLVNAQTRS